MLNVILETCAGTLTQGLIYAILSYGIFITYKILDFPDLTVDGSFPLGAAVTAVLLTHGVNAWLTLPIALVIGALAGLCTGLIHVRAKVRDLLAGIITMTALYSINLQIAGSNLMVERAIDTIYTSAPVMALLGSVPLLYRKLIVSLVLVVLIGLVLEWYFSTKNGLLLRAVGDNDTLVTTLAGAGVNLAGNALLIPLYGAMGAAVATLLSYLVILIARAVHSRSLLRVAWKVPRFVLAMGILLLQCVLVEWENTALALVCCLGILALYFRPLWRALKTGIFTRR